MSNHIMLWLRRYTVWLLLVVVAILIAIFPGSSRAVDSGFNMQVSPSPLAVTLKPGQRQTATLTVRNLSNHPETVTPSLSGFIVDRASQKIELTSDMPLGLDTWISFKQPQLTIAPGASQPLEILYDTPANAGFSYALAITLNPSDKPAPTQGANIKASVAVFNLINIDRPGAKRQLQIDSFTSAKSRYEFLPAQFSLTLQNTGNVIDQPTGSLFIQRGFNDAEPIATIPINKANSYILPNTSRTLPGAWDGGFPRYIQSGDKTVLRWDWKHASDLRFGKYVAKAVLVYNDGQRDVPLVASTTFWVIPWKLLLGTLVVGGLILTGMYAWGRAIFKGTKTVRKKYARRK